MRKMNRADLIYKFTTKKGLGAVTEQVGKIIDSLESELHDSELFGLTLVLTEIINNAVIHGNKNKQNSVSGEVKLFRQNRELSINISDEGEGFEWKRLLMEKNISPDPDETLSADGRGYMLVRMYGFTYSFNAKGNEVELVKEVKLQDE